MQRIATAVTIVGVIALLAVGLYIGGWWLREDSVNRSAEINRDSFERQTTLRTEIIDQYDDITRVDVQIARADDALAQPLRAQRIAMVDQLCSLADQLSDRQSIEPGIDRIITKECP